MFLASYLLISKMELQLYRWMRTTYLALRYICWEMEWRNPNESNSIQCIHFAEYESSYFPIVYLQAEYQAKCTNHHSPVFQNSNNWIEFSIWIESSPTGRVLNTSGEIRIVVMYGAIQSYDRLPNRRAASINSIRYSVVKSVCCVGSRRIFLAMAVTFETFVKRLGDEFLRFIALTTKVLCCNKREFVAGCSVTTSLTCFVLRNRQIFLLFFAFFVFFCHLIYSK